MSSLSAPQLPQNIGQSFGNILGGAAGGALGGAAGSLFGNVFGGLFNGQTPEVTASDTGFGTALGALPDDVLASIQNGIESLAADASELNNFTGQVTTFTVAVVEIRQVVTTFEQANVDLSLSLIHI